MPRKNIFLTGKNIFLTGEYIFIRAVGSLVKIGFALTSWISSFINAIVRVGSGGCKAHAAAFALAGKFPAS